MNRYQSGLMSHRHHRHRRPHRLRRWQANRYDARCLDCWRYYFDFRSSICICLFFVLFSFSCDDSETRF